MGSPSSVKGCGRPAASIDSGITACQKRRKTGWRVVSMRTA
jgi:hypothetical protein